MNKTAQKKPKLLIITLSVVLVVIIGILIWLWTVYGWSQKKYEITNFAMGSYVQQTIYGPNGEEAAKNAAAAVGTLENLISWRIEDSDIAKLNAQAGAEWTELNPKTISLLSKSLEVAEKSNGAFDPTILPISSLWDFGGENQHAPQKEQIGQLLPYVNYQELRVKEGEASASLKKHYNGVDLGAIGKGAACDEAIAAYEAAGVSGAIVAVGGSVGVTGQKPGGGDWSVAIRDPKSANDKAASMGVVTIDSGFVSTSGSYEKTFTEDGVTYHHLLNPKTGFPENNELLSVTIWCGDGALSDALSTACFVLGREKGMALAESYGAGAVFIDKNNTVYVNNKMRSRFSLDVSTYKLEDTNL